MRSVFFSRGIDAIGNLCPYLFYVLFQYWFWWWEVKLQVSGVRHLFHCSIFSITSHLKHTLASHILIFFCHITALLKILIKPAACLREVLFPSFENKEQCWMCNLIPNMTGRLTLLFNWFCTCSILLLAILNSFLVSYCFF